MADNTPVYWYRVTLIEYEGKFLGGKDLTQKTTWGELKKHWPKGTIIPKKVFGPSEPMYVLDTYYDGRQALLVSTKMKIGEHLDNITDMSNEDQEKMIENVLAVERLSKEIKVAEANLSLLAGQISTMEKRLAAHQAIHNQK